jgi:hypothetical protein
MKEKDYIELHRVLAIVKSKAKKKYEGGKTAEGTYEDIIQSCSDILRFSNFLLEEKKEVKEE